MTSTPGVNKLDVEREQRSNGVYQAAHQCTPYTYCTHSHDESSYLEDTQKVSLFAGHLLKK